MTDPAGGALRPVLGGAHAAGTLETASMIKVSRRTRTLAGVKDLPPESGPPAARTLRRASVQGRLQLCRCQSPEWTRQERRAAGELRDTSLGAALAVQSVGRIPHRNAR